MMRSAGAPNSTPTPLAVTQLLLLWQLGSSLRRYDEQVGVCLLVFWCEAVGGVGVKESVR